METNTALIRANSIVELYAITEVGLHFTLIIHPRDAESKIRSGSTNRSMIFAFSNSGC